MLQISRLYAPLSYLLGFILCALGTYYAVKYMQAYAVVVVVVWGAFLAKPIVEVVIFFYQMAKNAPLRPYQGRYYVFDNQHIRIIEINNALWVVDDDLLRVIGLAATNAARRQDPPSQHQYIAKDKIWVYSQQAVLSLLQNSKHPAAPKLKNWLEKEVYAPYAKKHLHNLHVQTSQDN